MKSRQPPPELAPTRLSDVGSTSRASQVLTPRGGFMARPGLKAPPTHAVVVRGGDAPLLAHIPAARPSAPPTVAPEPPAPPALREREPDTLQAVPKRHYQVPVSPKPAPPGAVLESVPPASEAPTVESVPPPAMSRRAPARRAWTIVAAAAAGLLFGLASVATTLRLDVGSAKAGAPQTPEVAPPPPSRPEPSGLLSGSPEPRVHAVPVPVPAERSALGKATPRALPAPFGSVRGPAARRTIF